MTIVAADFFNTFFYFFRGCDNRINCLEKDKNIGTLACKKCLAGKLQFFKSKPAGFGEKHKNCSIGIILNVIIMLFLRSTRLHR